jgi:fido (protein-threonine AMPylation protein)
VYRGKPISGIESVGKERRQQVDTEIALTHWRGGQTAAERLAANLLELDGFVSIDPQCPLGGRDGLKDVICEKNGWTYVGAAYFPGSQKQFKEIREKFKHDLPGVKKNGADGIVFVTNQALTPKERSSLVALADKERAKALVYHVERIRLLLDSPSGYGLRLEYLDIDMSREEQLSFFSQWNRSFSKLLQDHASLIVEELSKRIDSLKGPQDRLELRLGEIAEATRAIGLAVLPKSDKSITSSDAHSSSTKALSLSDVCLIHRALMFGKGDPKHIGRLRDRQTWIGAPGSTIETASFVPIEPAKVVTELEALLKAWRGDYESLAASDSNKKLRAIAKFHSAFLSIHPFLDGNGRVARVLLSQQAEELFGHRDPITLEDRKPYIDALDAAHSGELSKLEAIIAQAIFGMESVPNSLE